MLVGALPPIDAFLLVTAFLPTGALLMIGALYTGVLLFNVAVLGKSALKLLAFSC